MMGAEKPYMPRMKAELGEDFTKPNPFTRFVRAIWEMTEEGSLQYLQDLINQMRFHRLHAEIASLFYLVELEDIQQGWKSISYYSVPNKASVSGCYENIHVVGFKNSGKTTLIARWIRLLKKQGFIGCCVKASWPWWTARNAGSRQRIRCSFSKWRGCFSCCRWRCCSIVI